MPTRRVLRTELITTKLFGLDFAQRVFRVGEPGEPGESPPAWYFTYTEVGKNVEGRHLSQSQELFADVSDSEDDDDEFRFAS